MQWCSEFAFDAFTQMKHAMLWVIFCPNAKVDSFTVRFYVPSLTASHFFCSLKTCVAWRHDLLTRNFALEREDVKTAEEARVSKQKKSARVTLWRFWTDFLPAVKWLTARSGSHTIKMSNRYVSYLPHSPSHSSCSKFGVLSLSLRRAKFLSRGYVLYKSTLDQCTDSVLGRTLMCKLKVNFLLLRDKIQA